MKRHQLDVTNEHCPMTFVKTKLELAKLAPGDILEVLLAAGEPLDNLPRSAAEQGLQILETVHVDKEVYRVVIQK